MTFFSYLIGVLLARRPLTYLTEAGDLWLALSQWFPFLGKLAGDNPHALYNSPYTPLPGNTKSAVQLAYEHLTALGDATAAPKIHILTFDGTASMGGTSTTARLDATGNLTGQDVFTETGGAYPAILGYRLKYGLSNSTSTPTLSDKWVWHGIDYHPEYTLTGEPAVIGTQMAITGLTLTDPVPAVGKNIDRAVALAQQVINSIPVGEKIVLSGLSQGSFASRVVYDELRRGALQSRKNDLIGVVNFGDACRPAGRSIPGGNDPGGEGACKLPMWLPLAQQWTPSGLIDNPDTFYWSFANPNDAASCTQSGSTFTGSLIGLACKALLYGPPPTVTRGWGESINDWTTRSGYIKLLGRTPYSLPLRDLTTNPTTRAVRQTNRASTDRAALQTTVGLASTDPEIRAIYPQEERPMAKITVIECYGTFDKTGTTSMVRGSIDPDYFNYVPVTNYPNVLDNFGNSVAQGVAAVKAVIAATPGKIVLTGVSQGAQIMATVYRDLKDTPRGADFVGIYLVGNPLRQAGRAFPGANPIPPGHGVAPAQYRLTNTPDLIWEFANPGDPVCTIGDDAFGLGLQAAFGEVLQGVKPASNDLFSTLTSTLGFITQIALQTKGKGVIPGVNFNFPGVTIPFLGTVYVIPGVYNAITQPQSFLNKHQYYEAFKPIAGDPRSGRQIICDHLNLVIAPQHASAPVASTPKYYGLLNDNFTPRIAAGVVARWNDKRVRHTVYTVCGTSQDGWGLVNLKSPRALLDANTLLRQITGNPALNAPQLLPTEGTPGPNEFVTMDAAVGRAVNPDLFDWVPISYPAASPKEDNYLENGWEPENNSLAQSARYGTEELIRQINATPGTFALVGMSQGSVVISQVLKALLPGGVLAHRYNDCIAGLAYGNPCRQKGSGLPGVVPSAGAGVISATYAPDPFASGLAAVKLPSWWWEFSNPGDLFSTAPMDTVAGPIFASTVQSLYHFDGGLDFNAVAVTATLAILGTATGDFLQLLLAGLVANGFYSALQIAKYFLTDAAKAQISMNSQKQISTSTALIQEFLADHVGTFDLLDSIRTKTLVFNKSNRYPNGDPHVRYGIDKPPSLPTGLAGVNSNSTYVDVGIAYLNARGAAVAPR
jgi:hypothetical protein